MSRAKAFISILMVLILTILSGASVWASPRGQGEDPTATPTEEPTVEPTEEPTLEPTEEPPTVHPVASALAEYFADKLNLDYQMIMDYHTDGMGFGVIAQACWLSLAFDDPASKLPEILNAKKGLIEFSSITLPDGTTAKNWGQFRKAVLGNDKAKKNLGAIMSGRAKGEQDETGDDELGATAGQGKGKKGTGGKPEIPPGKDNKGGGKKK